MEDDSSVNIRLMTGCVCVDCLSYHSESRMITPPMTAVAMLSALIACLLVRWDSRPISMTGLTAARCWEARDRDADSTVFLFLWPRNATRSRNAWKYDIIGLFTLTDIFQTTGSLDMIAAVWFVCLLFGSSWASCFIALILDTFFTYY